MNCFLVALCGIGGTYLVSAATRTRYGTHSSVLRYTDNENEAETAAISLIILNSVARAKAQPPLRSTPKPWFITCIFYFGHAVASARC